MGILGYVSQTIIMPSRTGILPLPFYLPLLCLNLLRLFICLPPLFLRFFFPSLSYRSPSAQQSFPLASCISPTLYLSAFQYLFCWPFPILRSIFSGALPLLLSQSVYFSSLYALLAVILNTCCVHAEQTLFFSILFGFVFAPHSSFVLLLTCTSGIRHRGETLCSALLCVCAGVRVCVCVCLSLSASPHFLTLPVCLSCSTDRLCLFASPPFFLRFFSLSRLLFPPFSLSLFPSCAPLCGQASCV